MCVCSVCACVCVCVLLLSQPYQHAFWQVKQRVEGLIKTHQHLPGNIPRAMWQRVFRKSKHSWYAVETIVAARDVLRMWCVVWHFRREEVDLSDSTAPILSCVNNMVTVVTAVVHNMREGEVPFRCVAVFVFKMLSFASILYDLLLTSMLVWKMTWNCSCNSGVWLHQDYNFEETHQIRVKLWKTSQICLAIFHQFG